MEEGGFGPHVIKMGHYDEAMMERVCQKYKKMGYSVQMKGNIIKLNVINAQTCLQVNLSTVNIVFRNLPPSEGSRFLNPARPLKQGSGYSNQVVTGRAKRVCFCFRWV